MSDKSDDKKSLLKNSNEASYGAINYIEEKDTQTNNKK
jgi:hypothetical protein